jgi:hypothetical protein
MAEHLFSVPLDAVAPKRKRKRAAPTPAVGRLVRRSARPRSKPTVTLQWEDADGRATGAPRELQVPDTVPLEFPSTDGRMSWTDIPSSLSFSDDPPDSAVALRLMMRDRVTRIPRTALRARAATSLPTPRKTPFGAPEATFLVPVFSERFADEATFLARFGELHAFIMGQKPFNREPAKSRIGLIAHFWPSDPASGLFGTTDDKSQDERLFFGDRVLAKTLLDPFIGNARVSLILINSTKRGGAGGVPGFSAWTSITPGEHERWEAVCLHEIGHGLGLADEYLDELRQNERPDELEPNVSKETRPSRTPWHGEANQPDDREPSFPLLGQDDAPDNAVGTFQGARYRKDLFRATLHCLMRDTTKPFCVVCQKHIEKALSTPPIV